MLPPEPAGGTVFAIVGIGASAGGLEAFEHFFRAMSPGSGLAFVLVPHLDPNHVSILTEILQRCTTMPVVEAADRMTVTPNHVYVIPPNRDMVIFHGKLQLSLPDVPRGQRMPIDTFLRSLAADRGERSIGIILSGTGTDGTQGLRAILGAGGVTLVQEPSTAKYDGMPASAVHSRFATHVLPLEKMPAVLMAHSQAYRRSAQAGNAAPLIAIQGSGLNRVLMHLRSATGSDFSLYKKSTVARRIERRMEQHGITDIETYARYLKENADESRALFRELLINVTSFFRDPEVFVALKNTVFPLLLADKPEDYVARIWVAGCSTGEEVYSIAMLLREYMAEARREFKVQLYGTDLDDDAITVARTGRYQANISIDVTAERLRSHFVKEDSGYRVRKEIREMAIFAVQNAVKDPPFTKLDIISCRNLLIYLEPELQNRLISTFHYALKPGGVLLLSPSESVGDHADLFTTINRKWRLYQATKVARSTSELSADKVVWAPYAAERDKPRVAVPTTGVPDFTDITRRALLQSYAPASLLTDPQGDVLFVHGETGKYLRPAPGRPSYNVIDMALDGNLQMELRTAILSAAGLDKPTLNREVSVKNANGDMQSICFSVRPLISSGSDGNLLLVSFMDGPPPSPVAKPGRNRPAVPPVESRRIADLERELSYARESLQSTNEAQQAANEELKSTNEELQSINEELQSTNEEMETSREELQSVNEELISVNAELHGKIEQLTDIQNDMKNLLDNVTVGTIFLDQNLRIRRFSREAARIYRLMPADVGRPLSDIKSDILDDLTGAAETVLETLAPHECEVCAGNVHYLTRIQPYRTLDNVIAGVVLTFSDISKRAEAEAAERVSRLLAESIVATVREPLVVLDGDLRVVSASRSFYRTFQTTAEVTMGRLIYELGDGQWNIPALRELLEEVLPRDQSFDDLAVEHDFPIIGRSRMLLNGRRVIADVGSRPLILLAMEPTRA